MRHKFRVWDTDNEYMHRLGFYIEADGTLYSDTSEYAMSPYAEIDTVKPDRYVLMQHTGLNDKNGVEIYFDDVVKMAWTIFDEEELFKVRGKPGHAPRVDNQVKGKELWLCNELCEVVGNVWENPELMEVAE